MALFAGNFNQFIDWDKVLASIKPQTGDHNTVQSVVSRSTAVEATTKEAKAKLKEYQKVIGTWEQAGYDLNKIEWYDYYPGEHFDIEVQNTFAKLVNLTPRRVFISEVMPGKCVPYHYDVEDEEAEWTKLGKITRYTAFIDKPKVGHVLILEDAAYHNCNTGNVYLWDSYKSHHAGVNCGTEPYYLFHFVGTTKI